MEKTKELTIKLDGRVLSSNLTEFVAFTEKWVNGINMDLKTDLQFGQAEKDIKQAKLLEDRIHNAKQAALAQIEEIFTTFNSADKCSEKIRQVRLKLTNLVNSEKEKLKAEIINGGMEEIETAIAASPAKHLYVTSRQKFQQVIRGKKSISKMKEAVAAVVDEEKKEIEALAARFQTNLAAIEALGGEYQALFPDKMTLAGQEENLVHAEIQARIAKHKLATIEAESAKQEQVEQEPTQKEEVEQPSTAPVIGSKKNFIITFEVTGTKEKTQLAAKKAKAILSAAVSVKSARLKEI